MELYKKRQMKLRGEFPDVYQYEVMPSPLIVQLSYIIHGVLRSNNKLAFEILRYISRDLGIPPRSMHSQFNPNNYREHIEYAEIITNYTASQADIEIALSLIELTLRQADQDHLIAEFNQRCRENGFGFQFEEGQMVRVDNQFLHQETVVPALTLLSAALYQGAQEEFLKAHDSYRHGNYQDALLNTLKSIESTIKIICTKRNWSFTPTDPFKKLLGVCFDHNLIPAFWQSHMTGLRAILEGGVPTARNKLGGHGQGTEVVEVPEYLVSYVLHMTAATIVFLVKAEQSLPL